MFRRTFAILLVGMLSITLLGLGPVNALAQDTTQSVEKVRADIARLSAGKDARVKVKLHDDTKVEGYISQKADDSFTIVDAKTGSSRTVAYSEVKQVSKLGNGMSTMTKILIGAAVATGAIVGWVILKPALCDGGAQTRGPC